MNQPSRNREASNAKEVEERIAFLETHSSPVSKPSKSSYASSAILNDDGLNERLVRVETLVKWTLCLVLVLMVLVLGVVVLVSLPYVQNMSFAPLLFNPPQEAHKKILNASEEVLQLRNATTTTTKITRTTTATPTTYKHWDWKTNCGVKPLNDAGYFGVWPWQVLLREMKFMGKNDWEIQNKCGGVLLNSKFVLTAAHCQPTTSFWVGLGDSVVTENYGPRFEVTHYVKKVFVHPDYVAGTFDNDLALLELTTPVKFQEHILPICLPTEENNHAGGVATVAGWGSLSHGEEKA